MARITLVLVDLALLPSRRRVAELGIGDMMAGHGEEPRLHVALLAHAHPVDRRPR